MVWQDPCAPRSGLPGGGATATAQEIVAELLRQLAVNPLPVQPAPIKGQAVYAWTGPKAAAYTSTAIDVRRWNGASIQVFITGTTPSGVIAVQGAAEEGGNYQTLADTQATKTVTANTAFDVQVGMGWIRIDLSSVTGTFANGEGFVVLVKPFVSPGSTNLSVASASSVDVSDRAARDNGKVDVALLDQYTPIDVDSDVGDTSNALPVALRFPGGTPVTAPGDASGILAQGQTAHDAAATGNPVRVGAKAVTANPTAVAANDAVNAIADTLGRQIVTLDAIPGLVSQFNSAAITDNNAADLLAASGDALKWCLDWIIVTNSNATVGTLVTIQDDTAGTAIKLCQGYCAPAGGGFAFAFTKGSPKGGANQKLQVICGTTGSSIYVSGAAHKEP